MILNDAYRDSAGVCSGGGECVGHVAAMSFDSWGQKKKEVKTVIRQLEQRHRHVFQVVLAFCRQEIILNS